MGGLESVTPVADPLLFAYVSVNDDVSKCKMCYPFRRFASLGYVLKSFVHVILLCGVGDAAKV
eukprot:1773889-Karenia_brevis.AAC.1